MRRYLVIYEQAADGGWGAYVPDLPGCFTLGETREDAATYIREAIASHLALLTERGETVPEPTSREAELIDIA
jgi:predicted RNase H-like HicB family nuclease